MRWLIIPAKFVFETWRLDRKARLAIAATPDVHVAGKRIMEYCRLRTACSLFSTSTRCYDEFWLALKAATATRKRRMQWRKQQNPLWWNGSIVWNTESCQASCTHSQLVLFPSNASNPCIYHKWWTNTYILANHLKSLIKVVGQKKPRKYCIMEKKSEQINSEQINTNRIQQHT